MAEPTRIANLVISSPANDECFEGISAKTIHLNGQLTSEGHPELYYTWYSSLKADSEGQWGALARTKLAAGSQTDLEPCIVMLGPGSHVITLVAKDFDDSLITDGKVLCSQYAAATDFGMAGGPPSAESPCVIHVFVANIVEPKPTQTGVPITLSKANATLSAEAPVLWPLFWDKPDPKYPDYKEYNRLRYVWTFSRPNTLIELASDSDEFKFERVDAADHDTPCTLAYKGSLPEELTPVPHELRPQVEDTEGKFVGALSDPLQVQIV